MTRQACLLAAFTLLVVSGTAWPQSSSTSSEESAAIPDTMEEYRVSPLPPHHTDEDGKLKERLGELFCALFIGGVDLPDFMYKYVEKYFGKGAVLEEVYPHIRCHQLSGFPLSLPEMDMLRLMIERPERTINFLTQFTSYFQRYAKYPEFFGKILSCRVKYHWGCMDFLERVDRRIIRLTDLRNNPGDLRVLTRLREYLLEQVPIAGPIERDVQFCQEILHEPLECRDSSISDRLSLIDPLPTGDFSPFSIEAGPRCVPL